MGTSLIASGRVPTMIGMTSFDALSRAGVAAGRARV
jgi:hypothetical protein